MVSSPLVQFNNWLLSNAENSTHYSDYSTDTLKPSIRYFSSTLPYYPAVYAIYDGANCVPLVNDNYSEVHSDFNIDYRYDGNRMRYEFGLGYLAYNSGTSQNCLYSLLVKSEYIETFRCWYANRHHQLISQDCFEFRIDLNNLEIAKARWGSKSKVLVKMCNDAYKMFLSFGVPIQFRTNILAELLISLKPKKLNMKQIVNDPTFREYISATV